MKADRCAMCNRCNQKSKKRVGEVSALSPGITVGRPGRQACELICQ